MIEFWGVPQTVTTRNDVAMSRRDGNTSRARGFFSTVRTAISVGIGVLGFSTHVGDDSSSGAPPGGAPAAAHERHGSAPAAARERPGVRRSGGAPAAAHEHHGVQQSGSAPAAALEFGGLSQRRPHAPEHDVAGSPPRSRHRAEPVVESPKGSSRKSHGITRRHLVPDKMQAQIKEQYNWRRPSRYTGPMRMMMALVMGALVTLADPKQLELFLKKSVHKQMVFLTCCSPKVVTALVHDVAQGRVCFCVVCFVCS